MRYSYPVILIPAEEGGFTVLVPDLQGCVTEGETVEEALDMAKDAINGWIEVTVEQSEDIPKPSSLEDLAKRLNDILDEIIDSADEREQIIIAHVRVDIPKAAA